LICLSSKTDVKHRDNSYCDGIYARLLSFSVGSLQDDVGVVRNIGDIESGVLELRRNEKYFLARKDIKYLDKFNKKIKQIKKHLATLNVALLRIIVRQQK
jgi:hypothetical protein